MQYHIKNYQEQMKSVPLKTIDSPIYKYTEKKIINKKLIIHQTRKKTVKNNYFH